MLNLPQISSLPLLKSKYSAGFIFGWAMILAIASATVIYQLNNLTEESGNARLLLTKLKEQVSRLNSLEWEGISKGEIDENLTEELA
ncbi:hypothetical protein [Dapis sp. BLCC M172]|uniref:hypothetical protein n=1 Tax=Dapis sp. BLCC M172 TaxID=2975281 RepID=UPI003CF80000